jgi:hypothetical protein
MKKEKRLFTGFSFGAAIICMTVVFGISVEVSAQTYGFNILHSFSGKGGAQPYGSLGLSGAEQSTASTCAFYSPGYSAPWSQSPAALSTFLSGEHLAYDLDGWFFYGSLVEQSGQTSAFLMAFQRINEKVAGIPIPFFPAAIGYNNPSLDGYRYGGCIDIDLAPLVTVTQNPWQVSVVCPTDPPGLMSMTLLSGQVGQAGATYLLSAALSDQLGEPLNATVILRDCMGAVKEGYGPSSFYPQWITEFQRVRALTGFRGSLGAYLASTADPMACQGSYYYSLGLLSVEDFKIGAGSRNPLATGNSGTFWMDYVVQTYDRTAQSVIAKASWLCFVLQFPSRGEAMLINQLNTSLGCLNIARLYKQNSAITRNGSLDAFAQSNFDLILIEPVAGSNWTSPKSGLTYPMEYRILLPGWPGSGKSELTLSCIRQNQEIVFNNTVKYEGLMTVTGWLAGEAVSGQAWGELQPAGHL